MTKPMTAAERARLRACQANAKAAIDYRTDLRPAAWAQAIEQRRAAKWRPARWAVEAEAARRRAARPPRQPRNSERRALRRADIEAAARALVADGVNGLTAMARALNERGIQTMSGRPWALNTAAKLLARIRVKA
jgi:hypothetical protein